MASTAVFSPYVVFAGPPSKALAMVGDAVAENGAVQSRVFHEVLAAYGAVGVDVSQVLHKRNDCQGHEHKDSRNKLTSVYVAQAFLTPKAPDFSCLLKNDYVAGKLSFERDNPMQAE